ncbi:Uncharacterised protein [Mycobacterium tuberculosis]|nr:Uncharacterised protein [Mycobacterium tuberculosis]
MPPNSTWRISLIFSAIVPVTTRFGPSITDTVHPRLSVT